MKTLISRLIAAAMLAVLSAAPAVANTIVSETRLLQGSQTMSFELEITGPGFLTIRLQDLNWLGRLQNLSFAIIGSSGPSLQPTGSPTRARLNAPPLEFFAATGGERSFQISGSGKYYAYVSGLAGGTSGMGLFALNASFNGVAPVPLPAAAWLFGAGLVAFGATLQRRRRAGGPVLALPAPAPLASA